MGTNTNLMSLECMTEISSAVIPLKYEIYNNLIPTKEVKIKSVPSEEWHYHYISESDSYINFSQNEKLDIIMNFSKKLINNSTEIDMEFVDIVDNNFWNLL